MPPRALMPYKANEPRRHKIPKARYKIENWAAYGGAPLEVVVKLLRLGAWRTLQNARGERPVDVAERQGHQHLLGTLTPVLQRRVPIGVLLKIQSHFHDVIRGRAVEGNLQLDALRLPELEHLLEIGTGAEPVWFAVPGMYGGFAYSLRTDGVEAALVSESWYEPRRHKIPKARYRIENWAEYDAALRRLSAEQSSA
jgi:hypothetical protein